jgi:methylmalonyl-CoA/ethylmalonyl-CoA epimerase
MRTKRIDHVVIAVEDLDAAVATYQETFGLTKVSGGALPSLGIRNVLLQIGDAQLELMTPLSDAGPVADFLTKHGGGMYLLSLEVDDLDAAIAELKDKGARVNVAEGSGGQRLAFVSPRATHGVLLQLLEHKGS